MGKEDDKKALFLNPPISIGKLETMQQQYKETQLLYTGIRLGVFTYLDQPTSYQFVAKKTHLNKENTRYFLDALAAIELLTKQNGLYRNTELARVYLSKNSDAYMGDAILFHEHMTSLQEIETYLKLGPDPEIKKKNEGKTVFEFDLLARMGANRQRLKRAEVISKNISQIFQDRSLKKMIDLGGGAGLITLAIAQSNPQADCTVLETKTVAPATSEILKRYGGEQLVRVMTGDFVLDPIGQGYDLILSVASIQFAKSHFKHVLAKFHAALTKGGLFISICHGITAEGTKPKEIIVGWLPSNLMGLNVLLKENELKEEALKQHFESVDGVKEFGLKAQAGMEIYRKI